MPEHYRIYHVVYDGDWSLYSPLIEAELTRTFKELIMFRPYADSRGRFITFAKATAWSPSEEAALWALVPRLVRQWAYLGGYVGNNFRTP